MVLMRCLLLTNGSYCWQNVTEPFNGGMIENYTNGVMVRNSRLMIFWLFYMLYYVKGGVEFDFPINFDCQVKLTELSQFIEKIRMIENWESRPYDFLIIFNAIFLKLPLEFEFRIIFGHQKKLTVYRSFLKKN